MIIELTPTQRRFLRAQAHHLNPVVIIGEAGLTENVMIEIDRSLTAHELIKVRVFGDDRMYRQELLNTICDTLKAVAVQQIGKILILYRAAEKPAIILPKE